MIGVLAHLAAVALDEGRLLAILFGARAELLGRTLARRAR